ncbi:MAG TPA: nucleoside hydrolase, partial [Candidatus Dormibacteraeota bacterium]|nr:nucleoside hydrolase [Candidatus Dormibacteraeota bacterium]
QEAYFEQTGEHGISLPDPVAMSIALDPSVVTNQTAHYVDVETTSELTRGMTVVDRLKVAANDRNKAVWVEVLKKGVKAKVVWTIDIPRWKQALYKALA